MQVIRLFLDGWGILSPAEFYFGIGICIAAVLLLATALIALSALRSGPPAAGRRFPVVVFAFSAMATAGLLLMAAVPCFFPPDETPEVAWGAMAVGDLVAFVSVLGLLSTLAFLHRAWLAGPGVGESIQLRLWTFLVPLFALVAVVRAYQLVGVH